MMPEAFLVSGSVSLMRAGTGFGSDADRQRQEEKRTRRASPSIQLQETEQAVIDALANIFSRAQPVGSDECDATPVSAATLKYALEILGDLPLEAGLPEIGADADGDISLDWDFGPRRVFSVRISRDGTLYYAGLYGYSTYHGKEMLQNGIPKSIAEGIKRAIREP